MKLPSGSVFAACEWMGCSKPEEYVCDACGGSICASHASILADGDSYCPNCNPFVHGPLGKTLPIMQDWTG